MSAFYDVVFISTAGGAIVEPPTFQSYESSLSTKGEETTDDTTSSSVLYVRLVSVQQILLSETVILQSLV